MKTAFPADIATHHHEKWDGSGTQFDPVITQEFLKIREKVSAINERYKIK